MRDVLQRIRDRWRLLRPVWRVLLVALLVTGLVTPGVWIIQQQRICAQGIARVDDGCVGITDGSHGPVFGAATAEALRLIGEENARIAADPGDVEAVARGGPGLREGLQANASVAYTALAHPAAWQAGPDTFAPGTAEYLTGGCAECFPTLFPDRSLDDGYAIMGYDAVLTAVTAIRQPDGSVSSPEAVIQEFKRLHGPQAVAGASGWISLDPTGSPVDKAVPIMEVMPDGSTRFLQLSSPSGTPCRPGTAPC